MVGATGARVAASGAAAGALDPWVAEPFVGFDPLEPGPPGPEDDDVDDDLHATRASNATRILVFHTAGYFIFVCALL
jgi:hypothetical protein